MKEKVIVRDVISVSVNMESFRYNFLMAVVTKQIASWFDVASWCVEHYGFMNGDMLNCAVKFDQELDLFSYPV